MAASEDAAGIMLVESEDLIRQIPGFLNDLTDGDRERLLSIGQNRTFQPNEPLWRQGDPHLGIYVIGSGRIRSFYLAPSGREVTLAYWFAGNFVGSARHFWRWPAYVVLFGSHDAADTIFLPGAALRKLTLESAPIAVALLDALSFKARCYSAMAQMMGTRSATERLERLLAFLATIYGMKDEEGLMIGVSFTHGGSCGR